MSKKHPEYLKGAFIGIIIGAVAGDLIPTPVDAYYFYRQKKMRDNWKKEKVTPLQWWSSDLASYYVLNPIYWAVVGLISAKLGTDSKNRLKIFGGIAGAGIAVALIIKFIMGDINASKDEHREIEELFAKHPQLKELLNSPEFSKYKLIKSE